MPLIDKTDFDCIGYIVNHCDYKKLNLAICEAEEFDMPDLFCGLWNDIKAHWSDTSGKWFDLINGADFTDCANVKHHFKGVKSILAYYAYSRYLFINRTNDTATGQKLKTDQFSMPVPLEEIKMQADKYRRFAQIEYNRLEAYLCLNKDLFQNFNSRKCKSCGCNGLCGNNYDSKGYGYNSHVITKG